MSMLPEMMRWAGCIAVFAAAGLAVAADADTVDQAERYREELQQLRQLVLDPVVTGKRAQRRAGAASWLGFMKRTGWGGMPQDYEEAFELYSLALDIRQRLDPHGGHYLMYVMGKMHQHGWGVEQDDAEAMRWYKKAMNVPAGEKIHNDLRYEMAWRYYLGDGVQQDYHKAAVWYEQMAAETPWTRQYPFETGVDLHTAAESQYILGEMYRKGQGVPVHPEQAAAWYGRASSYDYPDAHYRLAIMQRTGTGVPQDNESAYVLLTLAATGDPDAGWIPDAISMQQDMAAELAPATIARLQARAMRERMKLEDMYGRTLPEPLADLAERMDCYGHMNGRGSRAYIMKRFFVYGILPNMADEKSAVFECDQQVSSHKMVVATIDDDGTASAMDFFTLKGSPNYCYISSLSIERGWGQDLSLFTDKPGMINYSDGIKMIQAIKQARPVRSNSDVLVATVCTEHRYLATDQGVWMRKIDK